MFTPETIIKNLTANGMTQKDIEEKTGISQATISRIASGKHEDPRFSTTQKLRNLAAEMGLVESEGGEM